MLVSLWVISKRSHASLADSMLHILLNSSGLIMHTIEFRDLKFTVYAAFSVVL